MGSQHPTFLPAAPHPWSSCPSVKGPSLSPAPKFSSRLCGIFPRCRLGFITFHPPLFKQKWTAAASLNPGSATECASQGWRGSGGSYPKEGPRIFQPACSVPAAPEDLAGGLCASTLLGKSDNSSCGAGGASSQSPPHLPVLPLPCAGRTREASLAEQGLSSERG